MAKNKLTRTDKLALSTNCCTAVPSELPVAGTVEAVTLVVIDKLLESCYRWNK